MSDSYPQGFPPRTLTVQRALCAVSQKSPAKLPAVIDRYINEIKRVSGVLSRVLKDKEYLVGNKYSYADASFVTWYGIMFLFAEKLDLEKEFPVVHAWVERMKDRPAIAKALEEKAAASQKH